MQVSCYDAWPGRVVSISVSPNTPGDCKVGLAELAAPSFPFGGKFGEFTDFTEHLVTRSHSQCASLCQEKNIAFLGLVGPRW